MTALGADGATSGGTDGSVGAAEHGDAPPERTLSGLIGRLVAGREGQAEAVLLAAAAAVAWVFRFAQDDAFITYRFARNAARGEGLVFNPGEQVEGYTNFLWTLMHVVPEELGWTTPLFSQVVGVALMVVTVWVSIRIATELFGSRAKGLLAGAVLVANMTFLVYSTGGLETMQQTLLVVTCTWAVLPALRTGEALSTARLLLAGAASGLALLTRLDSVVLLAVLLVVTLHAQWSADGRSVGRPARTLGVAALPLLALVVPWLVWKVGFYGELLPNTFVAKSSGNPVQPVLYGLAYVLVYFVSYGAFLLVGRFRRRRREFFALTGMSRLFWVVPVWFAYVVYVGADFMEWRFMVVITPVLALLAADLIDRFTVPRSQVLLVGVLLAFSLGHAVLVNPLHLPVLSFRTIDHWPTDSPTTWYALGNRLAAEFPGGPGVEGQPVMAVAPLGVISYYADLETVDMLGLTDAWVARNGDDAPYYYPGHVKMAPVSYLVDRGVSLVVGQPWLVDDADGRDAYSLSELVVMYPVADLNELPDTAVVVEIPATDDTVWPVIYLTPNDRVDEAIERNGWATRPIERTCDPEDLTNPLLRRLGSRTCPDV